MWRKGYTAWPPSGPPTDYIIPPLKVSLTTDYHQPKPTRLLLIRLNDDEITLNCPRGNPFFLAGLWWLVWLWQKEAPPPWSVSCGWMEKNTHSSSSMRYRQKKDTSYRQDYLLPNLRMRSDRILHTRPPLGYGRPCECLKLPIYRGHLEW